MKWRSLIAVVVLVILFIPIKRYELPGGLPFELEPYRIVVAVVVLGWIMSLLVDSRVRARASGFEAPLLFVLGGTLVSDLANPARISLLAGEVVKSLTFLLSFFLLFWLIVSVVGTRSDIEHLVKVLVSGGAVLAIAALVEQRTHYNVFNHLSAVMPVLRYRGINGVGNGQQLVRSGQLRAIGPAQHPIAFSVLFVLLFPFAIYLAHRYGGRWILAAVLLVLGILATASRTGVVALLVVAIFFVLLQPHAMRRLAPAFVAAVVLAPVAVPGTFSAVRQEFFPKGGLIANQADVRGNVSSSSGRLAKLGPALKEASRSAVFGEGFGTRIPTGPGKNAKILDDQWLGTLLETGFVGVVGWLWLFVFSVRRLVRAAKRDSGADGWLLTAFASSTAVFGVTMVAYDAFSFIQTTFIFFILLALAAALMNVRAGLPRS